MNKDADGQHRIFVNEMKLYQTMLDQAKKERDELEKKNRRLIIQLKTPRHHYEFMKENKVLEPFVKAVEAGDDVLAKWILVKNNKNGIDQVE